MLRKKAVDFTRQNAGSTSMWQVLHQCGSMLQGKAVDFTRQNVGSASVWLYTPGEGSRLPILRKKAIYFTRQNAGSASVWLYTLGRAVGFLCSGRRQ